MLLDTEVSELVVSNFVVIISVISENVLSDVFKFIFVFLKQSNQSSMDFFFIELLIFIGIIRNKQFINSSSYLLGKAVVRENELNFILINRWERAIYFKCVVFIKLIIIFRDVEFITKIFNNCQESFNPIEVLIKSDKSVVVFVNLSKDFLKNGFFEFVQLSEVE